MSNSKRQRDNFVPCVKNTINCALKTEATCSHLDHFTRSQISHIHRPLAESVFIPLKRPSTCSPEMRSLCRSNKGFSSHVAAQTLPLAADCENLQQTPDSHIHMEICEYK